VECQLILCYVQRRRICQSGFQCIHIFLKL
jgi:hypothetical protein